MPRDYPLDLEWLHDDSGGVCEIATRGHHSAAEFRRALRAEGEGRYDRHEVHFGWRRVVPRPGNDDLPRGELVAARPFARGAFPVTFIEVAP